MSEVDSTKDVNNASVNDYFDKRANDFVDFYLTRSDFKDRYKTFEKNINCILYKMDLSNFICMDIGCGSGILSRIVAKRGGQVIGIDQSAKMIKLAREEAERECLSNVTNYVHSSFPGKLKEFYGKCDLIIASSVLEYIEDPYGVLVEVNRLLENNGFFLVSLPNYWAIYRFLERILKRYSIKRYSRLKYQKHHFSMSGFKKMVSKCGFDYVRHEYFAAPSFVYKIGLNCRSFLIGNLFLAILRKRADVLIGSHNDNKPDHNHISPEYG